MDDRVRWIHWGQSWMVLGDTVACICYMAHLRYLISVSKVNSPRVIRGLV